MSRKNSRLPYTQAERLKILEYIIEKEAYFSLRGVSFWKELERNKVVCRTWQSAKEHFRKYIIYNLKHFEIPVDKKKKIIDGFNCTSQSTIIATKEEKTAKSKYACLNFSDEEIEVPPSDDKKTKIEFVPQCDKSGPLTVDFSDEKKISLKEDKRKRDSSSSDSSVKIVSVYKLNVQDVPTTSTTKKFKKMKYIDPNKPSNNTDNKTEIDKNNSAKLEAIKNCDKKSLDTDLKSTLGPKFKTFKTNEWKKFSKGPACIGKCKSKTENKENSPNLNVTKLSQHVDKENWITNKDPAFSKLPENNENKTEILNEGPEIYKLPEDNENKIEVPKKAKVTRNEKRLRINAKKLGLDETLVMPEYKKYKRNRRKEKLKMKKHQGQEDTKNELDDHSKVVEYLNKIKAQSNYQDLYLNKEISINVFRAKCFKSLEFIEKFYNIVSSSSETQSNENVLSDPLMNQIHYFLKKNEEIPSKSYEKEKIIDPAKPKVVVQKGKKGRKKRRRENKKKFAANLKNNQTNSDFHEKSGDVNTHPKNFNDETVDSCSIKNDENEEIEDDSINIDLLKFDNYQLEKSETTNEDVALPIVKSTKTSKPENTSIGHVNDSNNESVYFEEPREDMLASVNANNNNIQTEHDLLIERVFAWINHS